MEKVKVRFAPSPTGPLHIGGARSALFNYLWARHNNGTFLVRIEDTDLDRSSRSSEKDILDALRWLGLEWDEGIEIGGEYGPYRQTERLDIYRRYAEELLSKGLAYYCYCTDEELELERQTLTEQGKMPRYLGKCRDLSEERRKQLVEEGRKPVIRFRVPENQKVIVQDAVRGPVAFETLGIGDFIIMKSDGIPTYNFAVVVDDTLMEITDVIRGEEHLSNTPRQLLLYQALGFKPPRFAHISLILGKDRSKMSKRHGAVSVKNYQNQGYLPDALINFLALLGWSPVGEEEIFTREELINLFTLDRVAKNPAVFDLEKLNWLNGSYLHRMPVEELTKMVRPYLREVGLDDGNCDESWLQLVVASVQDYLTTLTDIKEQVKIYLGQEVVFEDEEVKEVLQQEQVPLVLKSFRAGLDQLDVFTEDEVKKMLKKLPKAIKLKPREVYFPLRLALTGCRRGPELYQIIAIIGKDCCLRRLESALNQF